MTPSQQEFHERLLLQALRDAARQFGYDMRCGDWIARVTATVAAAERDPLSYAPPVKVEFIRAMERRAGGYWVDNGNWVDDGVCPPRFIPRDTCASCGSHKSSHLDGGQCLFGPGTQFKETTP